MNFREQYCCRGCSLLMRVVLSYAVVQDLKMMMSPTIEDSLDKGAIAMFVAARARRCGGAYLAVKDKALEILDMLPAASALPDHEHPAVPAILSGTEPASAARYELIRKRDVLICPNVP